MKSIRNAAMIAAVVFGALGAATTFSSCSKDDKTINEDEPKTSETEKLVGTWSASEKYKYMIADSTTDSSDQNYELKIEKGTDNKIMISKIWNMDDIININATVSGSTITIAKQNSGNADYEFIEGSGTLESTGTKINIKYTLSNPTGNDNKIATEGTWTKK